MSSRNIGETHGEKLSHANILLFPRLELSIGEKA